MATRRYNNTNTPVSAVLPSSPAERQTYLYGRGSPH